MSAGGTAATQPGWSSYGNGPARWSAAEPAPATVARHFVLPLDGRITSQVLAADGTFFAATSAGQVAAFSPDGIVRWKVELGQLAHVCPQLDGYGVTGTGVIDPSAKTLYVADAFGRLHALALATGAERQGWPVRVFADYEQELAWGALSHAKGAVYVPTASYCELPIASGIHRVDLQTRKVTSWISVPETLGGGGGVWGWGGVAFSARDAALFAVTANAHPGGTNVGDDYSESAGFGEHLVRLSPRLDVQAASHPPDVPQRLDLDFVGSPVVLERAGCGELVAAVNKYGSVYGWRAGAIATGPTWKVSLEPFDPRNPMLAQLAWSRTLSSLYAVTGTQLVRIVIGRDCSPKVSWRVPLGTHTENGSPTIAGETVWFALNGKPMLVGHDARTGKRVFKAPLGGTTLVGPTILYDRLIVGTMTGLVEGFRFPKRALSRASPQGTVGAGGSASWVGARYGWESRADGVYATDDAGRTWRRIYAMPAIALLRTSSLAGVIEVALEPVACMCTTHKLWTGDGGRTWHATNAVGDRFTGSGSLVYWWQGGLLYVVTSFPPRGGALHSRLAASLRDGTIVAAAVVPGGAVALVSSRVHGQGWDSAPRVILANGARVDVVRLPEREGRILVHELAVDWPRLTVTGSDYAGESVRVVTWSSKDGGKSWLARS